MITQIKKQITQIKKIAFANNLNVQFSSSASRRTRTILNGVKDLQWYTLYTFLYHKGLFCIGLLTVLLLSLSYSSVRAEVGLKKVDARKVEYTSRDQRDPFKSPFEAPPGERPEPPMGVGLSHLTVQGMVWGSKMPQAIINNSLVKVGEIIEGAEILDIRKEGVYVLYEGRQYILRPAILR